VTSGPLHFAQVKEREREIVELGRVYQLAKIQEDARVSFLIHSEVNTHRLLQEEQEEIYLLALNVYFEAQKETRRGKLGVVEVVFNRVDHKEFPNSITKVITQPRDEKLCQFDWFCDGKSDQPYDMTVFGEILDLVRVSYIERKHGKFRGPIGHGVIAYHADWWNDEPADSWFRDDLVRVEKELRHIFYRLKTDEEKVEEATKLASN
jgi:hypothetical protein